MDNLTTVFVVKPSNTLPTTGSTYDLTAGQFGIFKGISTQAYQEQPAVATAGNAAAAKWMQFYQKDNFAIPGVPTRRSDFIFPGKLVNHYKVTASQVLTPQITEISTFEARCGEQLNVSLRVFSLNTNAFFYNGLTRTISVPAPCCDCGGDPCATLDAAATEALVVAIVNGINADPQLSPLVSAALSGTGLSSKVVITGKAVTEIGDSSDPTVSSHEYDRIYFHTFAYKGPATSQDQEYFDICDEFATVTVTQRANYQRGTSSAIKQMEINYWSENRPSIATGIFSDVNFNGFYDNLKNTVDGTFYDQYYLEFRPNHDKNENTDASLQFEKVMIAVPVGEAATIETIIETLFGAFVDASGPTPTSTTSTTTTSTSTTTTTLLFP